jgi:pentatricopeptide repeat protein
MIRVAAATHDAEKAMRLYNQMESFGFIATTKHYNSIIFALGSSKRYAEKAIEFWHKMRLGGFIPDEHTCVGVFRACAKLGDIETAFDAL